MINLQRKRGSTFDGFSIKAPFSLIGHTIECDFKMTTNGATIFKYTTLDGTLTIVNDTVTFQPRILNYNAATYKSDIKVTSPSGDINYWVEKNKPLESIIFQIFEHYTK